MAARMSQIQTDQLYGKRVRPSSRYEMVTINDEPVRDGAIVITTPKAIQGPGERVLLKVWRSTPTNSGTTENTRRTAMAFRWLFINGEIWRVSIGEAACDIRVR